MREIKFRALPIESKEFIYGSLVIIDGQYSIVDQNDPAFTRKEVILETICQYTGFKDANGTDIYEGDVLRDGIYNNLIVVWVKSEASFYLTEKINDYRKPYWHRFNVDIEPAIRPIIGNVYQNPELVKKSV